MPLGPRSAHEPGQRASRQPFGRRLAVLAPLVLGVLALSLLTAVATGRLQLDPACRPCHPSAPVLDAHRAVPCYSCHSEPGPLARAARLVLDASYALSGPVARPVEAPVPSAACESCHAEAVSEAVFADGIRMSHRTCVGRAAACTDCHSDVAHGRIGADRAVSMDRCSRCHDGTTAPKDCDSCHYGEPTRRDALNAWAVTHGRNRHQTHGMGDLRTCAICHQPEDCGSCHLPVPHGSAWPTRHGDVAVDKGRDACLACHVRELCDACHGIEMPHPAGWLPDHPKEVAQTDVDRRCKNCHAESDCRDCHVRHVHPGLRPGVPEALSRP